MAGIYIHIPFCQQACHYCDFHFSTNLSLQDEMVQSISIELKQRSSYLTEDVTTIYFGGGTPSLLSERQLGKVLEAVHKHFRVSADSEISLEANPEDLKSDKLKAMFGLGINRLSIGIQTFSESRLKWMNRIHSSDEAVAAYKNARSMRFDNISLDLIYAIPEGGSELWESDLKKLTALQPEHVSLYGLTIEDRTVFGKKKENGQLIEVTEDEAASQYLDSIKILTQEGYEQYEVSNFCKPGFRSQHNSSYWSGSPYLGVGPGAHSFNGKSRQFNIRNNAKYIKLVGRDQSYFESEQLSTVQRMNETILTRLRTIDGLDLIAFNKDFSTDLLAERVAETAGLRKQKLIEESDRFLSLTSRGILVADEIALQLFFEE